MSPPLLRLFGRYASVGVLNTALHWLVFLGVFYGAGLNQAYSNFIAFLVAVTFSFFANARYTFNVQADKRRYLFFVSFMAFLSYAAGWVAQRLGLPPLITLVLFSLTSLVVGFLYSRFVVFRA